MQGKKKARNPVAEEARSRKDGEGSVPSASTGEDTAVTETKEGVMSYSISVAPSTIQKGEEAVVEVSLPEQEDVVHPVEVFRRGTDERVASASVTIHAEQLTVGAEGDASTDYYIQAGGLTVVQTDARTFSVRTAKP